MSSASSGVAVAEPTQPAQSRYALIRASVSITEEGTALCSVAFKHHAQGWGDVHTDWRSSIRMDMGGLPVNRRDAARMAIEALEAYLDE